MPGIIGADDYIDYAQFRYNSLAEALKRLNDEAIEWFVSDISADGLDMKARNDILLSRARPTLCLFNMFCGCAYVGEFGAEGRRDIFPLLPILSLAITPDIYHPDKIQLDWSPITDMWREEAERIANRKAQDAAIREANRPASAPEEETLPRELRIKQVLKDLEVAHVAQPQTEHDEKRKIRRISKRKKKEETASSKAQEREAQRLMREEVEALQRAEERKRQIAGQLSAQQTRRDRQRARETLQQQRHREKQERLQLEKEYRSNSRQQTRHQLSFEERAQNMAQRAAAREERKRIAEQQWQTQKAVILDIRKYRSKRSKASSPDDFKPS